MGYDTFPRLLRTYLGLARLTLWWELRFYIYFDQLLVFGTAASCYPVTWTRLY